MYVLLGLNTVADVQMFFIFIFSMTLFLKKIGILSASKPTVISDSLNQF